LLVESLRIFWALLVLTSIFLFEVTVLVFRKTLKGLVPSTLLKISMKTITKILGTYMNTTSIIAFMKYLTPYSGKEDPEGWLERYQSSAKAEKWSAK